MQANMKGATAGTPFMDGGMLPYWVDAVNGTEGVMSAIYALNTSRPCTGTADSRIFPDFFPGTKTPAGEPGHRSGITGVSRATPLLLFRFLGYFRTLLESSACNKGGGGLTTCSSILSEVYD